MPRTVQIRDLDDETYQALSERAAEAGLSVPELLRRHARQIAARPTMREWVRRTRTRDSAIRTETVLADLDVMRGPWPDARR